MTYNPYSLEGKTIFITGASSGIGRSVAIECSKLGASVIITARNETRLNETLSLLEGNNHKLFICDLNNPEEVTSMIESLPEINGVINNAGYTSFAPIQFIDEEVMKGMYEVNTIAPIMILKTLVKKKKIKRPQ